TDSGNPRTNIQQPIADNRSSAGRGLQMPVPMGGAVRAPLTNSAAAERYRSSYPQPQSMRSTAANAGSPSPSRANPQNAPIGRDALPPPSSSAMTSGGTQSGSMTQRPPNVSRVPLPAPSKAFLEHAAEAGQESTTSVADKHVGSAPQTPSSAVGVPPSVPRRERPSSQVAAGRTTAPEQKSSPAIAARGGNSPPAAAATASKEATSDSTQSPNSVSLPTRLVNTPLAEQAAKAEAHSRPMSPSFRTAQYPTAASPNGSQPTVAEESVQRVEGNASPNANAISSGTSGKAEGVSSASKPATSQASLPAGPIANMPADAADSTAQSTAPQSTAPKSIGAGDMPDLPVLTSDMPLPSPTAETSLSAGLSALPPGLPQQPATVPSAQPSQASTEPKLPMEQKSASAELPAGNSQDEMPKLPMLADQATAKAGEPAPAASQPPASLPTEAAQASSSAASEVSREHSMASPGPTPAAKAAMAAQESAGIPSATNQITADKPSASLSIGNAPLAGSQSAAIANGPSSLQSQVAALKQSAPDSKSKGDSAVRVQSRLPRVQVDVLGPSSVQVGVPARYQVVVTNQDQFDLHGLILRLEVPGGQRITPGEPSHGAIDLEQVPDESSMITWGFDHLAASQVATAPITVASPTATDFSIGVEWTLMPVSEVAEVHVIAPKLQVELEGSQEVLFGAVNSYQLRVRNAGDDLARGVKVIVDAGEFGSSTASVGELKPGAEEVVDIELQFKQAGKIQVAAVAEAENHPRTSQPLEIFVRQPKVVAQLSAPPVVYHGSATTYSVVLRNVGDTPARDVNAQLVLPAGASPEGLPYGAEYVGQKLSWKIDELQPAAAQTFTFQINLPSEGESVVQFVCSDKLGNAADAKSRTVVKAISDLKLLVSDPVAPAPVGSEVIYELELTNRGSKAASNVHVITQFSQGIEPTRGSGHGYRVVPGQLFFDPIPQVAAGETVRLRVHALAEKDGVHRFRAEVRSDEANTRLVQEESTQYLQTQTQIASPTGRATLR
ncbi:MAG: hypothetical protein NXI32_04690, partial [bacterium]|nr:hypothetical protein [bacterium]